MAVFPSPEDADIRLFCAGDMVALAGEQISEISAIRMFNNKRPMKKTKPKQLKLI